MAASGGNVTCPFSTMPSYVASFLITVGSLAGGVHSSKNESWCDLVQVSPRCPSSNACCWRRESFSNLSSQPQTIVRTSKYLFHLFFYDGTNCFFEFFGRELSYICT